MSKKVLIVEDEVPIALYETQILKKHDYKVITAYEGEKAIEIVNSDPDISLILMDIDLGQGLDGIETAKDILESYNLPILFLTGHTEEEYIQRVEEITSYGIIQKISNEFIIIQAIEMAFRLFETHQREKQKEHQYKLLFDNSNESIVVVQDGMHKLFNNKTLDITEYNAEEFKNLSISDIVHPGDRERVIEKLQKRINGEISDKAYQYRVVTKSGTIKWLRMNPTRIMWEGKPASLGFSEDITLQKKAETALREKTEMLNNTLENISDLVALADVNGKITFHNNLYDTIGYGQDSLIGKNMLEFVHPDDLPEMDAQLKEFIQNKENTRRVELRFRRGDGSYIWMEIDGKAIKDGEGNIKELLLSARDITERKTTREALQKSEEKYRLLFNYSNDAIFVHEIGEENLLGRIVEVNEQACNLLGYSKEQLRKLSIIDLAPEKRHSLLLSQGRELLEKKHLTFETETVRSDGVVVPVEVSSYLYFEGKKRFVLSSFRDITERKNAEQAFIRRTTLLEKSQELATLGSWELDIVHDTWHFLEQWNKNHGITDTELETSSLLEIAHPEDVPRIRKAISEAREEGKKYDIEHRIIRADNGEIRYIKSLGDVEFNQETGRPVRIVGAAQDITNRKRREEELQRALEEKDYLMKELNHRVKNNLALVSSLVSLKDLEAEEDLSDLKYRIDVIKLVHEKLHQRSDIKKIEVQEYFQELLESIFSFTSQGDVEIVNDITEVSIPTKTVIPLGLLVNEIATNAIKHGFTSDKKARFVIALKEDEEHEKHEEQEGHSQYVLRLSNTGNSFPEDIGLENPKTMGLQLVTTLVAQLNGTVELKKKPNPVFTIRFPVTP